MTWGIIGALDAEVALLKAAMKVEKEDRIFEAVFYTGELEGKRAVLTCCGVGTVNAALCASVMLRELGADCIVNVGIAGGMDPRLGVLDVALSQSAAYYDRDREIELSSYPFRLEFDADPVLLELANRACEGLLGRNFSHYTGRIATGDQFVSDRALKEKIMEQLSPVCVDMEGAAIAQAAYMGKKPFLILRTVSDTAEEGAALSYSEFKERAADQASSIILEMLRLA